MTGTEPAAEAELSIEEYHAIGRELEAQFPTPTWDEVLEEWKWVHGHMADGTLDPQGRWCDRHVAVYNRQVVGADTNPLRLRVQKARELGIHPERLVITYLF